MSAVLSVRDRLKRQINALDPLRKKTGSLNDINCTADLQLAAELGTRAFNVPVRIIRAEHADVVVVGLAMHAGGHSKHQIMVPAAPLTNSQYDDYLDFRAELGPVEALKTVLEG